MFTSKFKTQNSRVAALVVLAAFGLGISGSWPGVSSARPVASNGIIGVTRGAVDFQIPRSTPPPGKGIDLRWRPTGAPPGETWRYGRVAPFQVAAGVAGVFLNIERAYGPGIHFEIGTDAVLFDDLCTLRADNAVALTRLEEAVNPNSDPPGERGVLKRDFHQGGFVPLGAKRKDGSPHPGAGTGFGLNTVTAWPLHDKDLKEWENAGGPKGRRSYQGRQSYSFWELQQLAYDGKQLRVVNTERIQFDKLLPGSKLYNVGLHTAIPDGDDLLVGMVNGEPDESTWGSGLARWRWDRQRWRPISFVPVAGIGYNQPSLVRDSDGSLLFGARGRFENENSIRVWRSQDGTNWKLIVDLPAVIANGPITLNQAADGSPYILANPYEVLLFPMRDPFRPPRDKAGRPRLAGWTREKMYLWPMNSDRTDVGAPILVRDCRLAFGTPPGGSTWKVDHPVGLTVQLRDGAWHHVLGYRVREMGEQYYQLGPTPQSGSYLEEVLSGGKPIPVWNF